MAATTKEQWAAAEAKAIRRPRRCRYCDQVGHNIRTCPKFEMAGK